MKLLDVVHLLSTFDPPDPSKECVFFSEKTGEPLFFTEYDQSKLWGCGCSDGMIFFFSKDPQRKEEMTWDYFFKLFSSLKNECSNDEGKVHSHYALEASCNWYYTFLDDDQEELLWQPLCLTRMEQTDKDVIFWFSEEESAF